MFLPYPKSMRIATPEEMVEYGKSIGEQYDYILLIGEL